MRGGKINHLSMAYSLSNICITGIGHWWLGGILFWDTMYMWLLFAVQQTCLQSLLQLISH